MNITVSISNKSFWVQTWKMLSDFARQSSNSTTKTAKTNPDGTVSVVIDTHLFAPLLAALEEHNEQYKGMNELRLLLNDDATNQHHAARA